VGRPRDPIGSEGAGFDGVNRKDMTDPPPAILTTPFEVPAPNVRCSTTHSRFIWHCSYILH
jgi:hypothetical protein